MTQVEKKTRKKREMGTNKKALSEIRHLVPHFTSRQLAARIQVSLEQAQKTCSYLKLKGYVKVVGYAKLDGLRGIPESLYGVTEMYEKARKKNPSLFEGLRVVPTPIEKALEDKKGVTPPAYQVAKMKLICEKIDGLADLMGAILGRMGHVARQFQTSFGIDDITQLRTELEELKRINPLEVK